MWNGAGQAGACPGHPEAASARVEGRTSRGLSGAPGGGFCPCGMRPDKPELVRGTRRRLLPVWNGVGQAGACPGHPEAASARVEGEKGRKRDRLLFWTPISVTSVYDVGCAMASRPSRGILAGPEGFGGVARRGSGAGCSVGRVRGHPQQTGRFAHCRGRSSCRQLHGLPTRREYAGRPIAQRPGKGRLSRRLPATDYPCAKCDRARRQKTDGPMALRYGRPGRTSSDIPACPDTLSRAGATGSLRRQSERSVDALGARGQEHSTRSEALAGDCPGLRGSVTAIGRPAGQEGIGAPAPAWQTGGQPGPNRA